MKVAGQTEALTRRTAYFANALILYHKPIMHDTIGLLRTGEHATLAPRACTAQGLTALVVPHACTALALI